MVLLAFNFNFIVLEGNLTRSLVKQRTLRHTETESSTKDIKIHEPIHIYINKSSYNQKPHVFNHQSDHHQSPVVNRKLISS